MPTTPPTPTLALSVRQPWAWLLFHGKDVENRTWATKFRGPFFVHASSGMTAGEYRDAVEFVRRFNPALAARIPEPKLLKRGGIVGTANLDWCKQRIQVMNDPTVSHWFEGTSILAYGFGISGAVEVPFQPCRGALGFFCPDLSRP